ncbi:hypothetical protein E4U42_005126 [Claviceps africana]|uniref:Uncharacterized protein n=1 Tax=Claviceps africana TaxID=83212 RepID=A0A8K0J6D4_9HYPO|nr:hypothetical protein E4U42_005126 [Claviceps africana]
MTSLIPLALGNECCAARDIGCLPSHENLLNRFPSVPSRSQSVRSSLQPLYLEQKTRQPKTEPVANYRAAPLTSMEWKTTLGEIKREYMNRRFRQCSTRCHEVLALGDKLDQAHPIHLVYVRFYAATALEMQARAVHHSSPSRASLLKQAYDHYSIASDLASQADQQASNLSSRARVDSFSLARLHSPTGSHVSDSTTSTRMSSPTPSLGSRHDTFKPTPKKKKVAFCDEPAFCDELMTTEPIIRPDSPTLGFDDWLGRSSPEPILPESILKPVKQPSRPMSPFIAQDALPPTPDLGDMDTDPFFHTRSVHRFCTILSSLRRQITSHMTTLDIEITACQIPTAPAFTSPEMKALDIQARIERLRACGWKRPRFNVQRYETLRENALADMME